VDSTPIEVPKFFFGLVLAEHDDLKRNSGVISRFPTPKKGLHREIEKIATSNFNIHYTIILRKFL